LFFHFSFFCREWYAANREYRRVLGLRESISDETHIQADDMIDFLRAEATSNAGKRND